MKKTILLSLIGFTVIFSCSKSQEKESSNEEPSFITKSINSVKSGAGAMKDYVVEPDSLKNARKEMYQIQMSKKYPEYNNILEFFRKTSPVKLESNGNLYRIIDLKITDNGTVMYKFDDDPNEVKYFYDAKENYYIYTFDITNKSNPRCTNLRRVKKGKFSQPVHDLIFEKNRLVREDFVADVSNDFFDKSGQQFFEIEKKIDGSKVINQYNLGPVKDF